MQEPNTNQQRRHNAQQSGTMRGKAAQCTAAKAAQCAAKAAQYAAKQHNAQQRRHNAADGTITHKGSTMQQRRHLAVGLHMLQHDDGTEYGGGRTHFAPSRLFSGNFLIINLSDNIL